MNSTHTLRLEQMANVVPLVVVHLLAIFVFNKILPNENHPALLFIYDLLSPNSPHSLFKIFATKFNNYNILGTDIRKRIPQDIYIYSKFHKIQKSQNFQTVIKFLPLRKSTNPIAEAECRYLNLVNGKWKHFPPIFIGRSKLFFKCLAILEAIRRARGKKYSVFF